MATQQQQIAEKDLAKLAESKDVDAEKSDQLRNLVVAILTVGGHSLERYGAC